MGAGQTAVEGHRALEIVPCLEDRSGGEAVEMVEPEMVVGPGIQPLGADCAALLASFSGTCRSSAAISRPTMRCRRSSMPSSGEVRRSPQITSQRPTSVSSSVTATVPLPRLDDAGEHIARAERRSRRDRCQCSRKRKDEPRAITGSQRRRESAWMISCGIASARTCEIGRYGQRAERQHGDRRPRQVGQH